ncbi:hypothetical protein P3T76_005923 [Phytophthora citrophthora]|uniref:Uncharacterized protein n=1 Tax=Phytophthora citrophthora TaxID=4793 RepID=A0AAD9GPX0_9STRA|nr:hypothetical protein P3T76_005923 [Phytophthora citrophthora]
MEEATAVAPSRSHPSGDEPEGLDEPSTASAEDSSSSAVAPTFVFATWKVELELMLQRESEALDDSVQELQSDFDDRSQLVRGDFAWRKQVTAYHDRLQDVLSNGLNDFTTNISKHSAQVAESLAQTLAKVERDGQRAVQLQEQKGEAALRRARTAMSKEVERITRLEKCLRLEEARQAAVTLAERECQLIAEHKTRESHLQALLSDMRGSNESLETLNSQLLEALRTSRTELDQLRNTLIKSIARPKRRSSSLSRRESNTESMNRVGGDKSAKNSITRGLESTPSPSTATATANDLLLVPALRQSLNAATQTVASLKSRVTELESARESDKQRLRDLQLSNAHAENEKLKAIKLLGEARSALIDNERKLADAAEENTRLRNEFDTMETLVQGREQALADAQKLEEATHNQLAALTGRLQRVMTVEVRWRELEHAVTKWNENQVRQKEEGQISGGCSDNGRSLERIVTSFLRLEVSEAASSPEVLSSLETQQELETRLRYEFEKKFGEQLKLRVSYERRRMLERLECLCATEAKNKQERMKRTQQSVPNVGTLESDFTRLKRLMKAAYNQLGICVGAWSETDVDDLHARLDALKAQVKAQERQLEAAANRAESQRVSLVRAELAQEEKDLLLAALTARYRQLRETHAAWGSQQFYQGLQGNQFPIDRKRLTVYGIPQPMAQKPKLQTLIQLTTRSRPASASASLGSVQSSSLRRLSQPPPSRLGSRSASNRNRVDLQRRNETRPEEVEEHVRSVLKTALMQPERENELEDTVGSDGVCLPFVAAVIYLTNNLRTLDP